MSLDGGGRITSWDGSAGEWACQQLPGWDEVSPLSPGVGTSPELFLGLEGGRTPQGNLLVMPRIGINAPFNSPRVREAMRRVNLMERRKIEI
jgi:hypothetical protein